jgi:hypothetical protein
MHSPDPDFDKVALASGVLLILIPVAIIAWLIFH